MQTNFIERNLSPEAQVAIDNVIKFTGTGSDIAGFVVIHPSFRKVRKIPTHIGNVSSIAGGTLEFLRENPEGGVREILLLGGKKIFAYVMDEFNSNPGGSEQLYRRLAGSQGSKELTEAFLEHINLQNEMRITYEEFREFFSTEWTEEKIEIEQDAL